MTTFDENFKLYFERVCRHLLILKTQPNDMIAFLDLCHSIRCLADVKLEIDNYFSSQNYQLNFPVIVNRKRIKKGMQGEIKIPYTLNANNSKYSDFSFSSRILSDDDISNFSFTEHHNESRIMTFVNFLGSEFISAPNQTICVEIFIRRIANKFSASHPYETDFNEAEKYDDLIAKHYYIDTSTMSYKLPNIYCGYLLVQILGEYIVKSMLPHFINKYQNFSFYTRLLD